MKEVLLYDAKDMRLVDSPEPTCGSNDILLKVKACAICPTDLRKYNFGKKGSPLIHLPMNMGHEWTGDVVEVGENVTYPEVGMRVRGSGFTGYAEYATVNILNATRRGRLLEDTIVEMPDNVSYLEGTFLENVGVGIHSVVDQAGGSIGSDIVIIGAGQMGLTQIMISKLIGATTIVTEMVDWRLDLAEKYGADYVIDISKEDPIEAVKKITKGKMADGVIITVGIPAAIIQGINLLGPRGRAVLFGGATLDTTITFNPNLIHYNDKALVGCGGGPSRGKLSMGLIASGKIQVKDLISHQFKLEELPEAFQKISENKLDKYLKGLVVFD